MDSRISVLDAGLIEGTILDLTAIIQRLQSDRNAVRNELIDLDKRIEEAEARLRTWETFLSQIANQNNDSDDAPRLRKGEALTRINELFDKLKPDTALTWNEISRQAGIPWSTVRNVLRREGSGYMEKEGNRWVRCAKAPSEPSLNGTH
jgi:hypothetical protein